MQGLGGPLGPPFLSPGYDCFVEALDSLLETVVPVVVLVRVPGLGVAVLGRTRFTLARPFTIFPYKLDQEDRVLVADDDVTPFCVSLSTGELAHDELGSPHRFCNEKNHSGSTGCLYLSFLTSPLRSSTFLLVWGPEPH